MSRIAKKIIRRILTSNNLAFQCYEQYSFSRRRSMISATSEEGNLRLHLGCGPRLLDGWVNLDAAINPAIVTAKLPRGLRRFEDVSAQFIYTSHLLEHIEYPREATEFVRECYRILRPGGVLRIVVPSIENIIVAYMNDDKEFFKIQATLHPNWCTTKLEHLLYALQQDGRHKYGYDFETMKKLLIMGGFTHIVQSDFNSSEFIELRIDYRGGKDNHGKYLSLFVEAIKC
jgi:predicted SAM-dependent methyltransferase